MTRKPFLRPISFLVTIIVFTFALNGSYTLAQYNIIDTATQELTCRPGGGGIIIEGNWAGDPETLNPLLTSATPTSPITRFLFPTFIGVDPKSGNFAKNHPNALATDWSISDDGKVYTFLLRDDWAWNDGTPMTSADIQYSWEAITSGMVNSPLTYLSDFIDGVETPDAHTVVVTFKNADCSALNYANLPVVPSHVLPSDFSLLNNTDYNLHPDVTAGPFKFASFSPGDSVHLTADSSYGSICPQADGFIYKSVDDQAAMVAQFLAGETHVVENPPLDLRAKLRAANDVTVYSFAGNTWDYLALNYADPKHPQSGGEDQGHHPLFGDVRVRQAIARAINVDDIIQRALLGEGTRMASLTIPSSFAFDDTLPPIPYDLEAADKLLNEAGWIDDDDNPDTPRIARDALYAPDGTPFQFTLITNLGGSRRETVGSLIQNALNQLGIAVEFQAINFSALMSIVNDQTFDAFILGWQNSYPDNPDQTQLFTTSGDVVGSGNNSTSYHHAEVDRLMEQARTLQGCDTTARVAIYHQIQAILQQDLPYIPLYAINEMYAARSDVNNFSPYPNQLYWNVDTWFLSMP